MPAPDEAPLTTEELRQRRAAARVRRTRQRRLLAATGLGAVVAVVVAVLLLSSNGSNTPATAAALSTIPTVLNAPQTPITKAHPTAPAKPGAYEHSLEVTAIRRAAKAHDYVISGLPRHKLIALTFDDGPGPTTPRIVNWLKRHDVPATFFLVGSAVNTNPDMARTEGRAGFVLGDHTETHRPLATLSASGQRAEIDDGARSIKDVTGRYVRLLRPPDGSFNDTTLQLLRARKLLMVLWSVDTKDYTKPGVNQIVFAALSGARAGGIILMHDGGGDRTQTLKALPRIVHRLRLRGYKLVTVPRLLVLDPVPKNQPLAHSLAGG